MRTSIFGFIFVLLASCAALSQETGDPERIQQIKKATDLLATAEDRDGILKAHDGYKFSVESVEQEVLSKPTFEWIQNNLFTGIEKPFVGYFPLKEEGELLGFVIYKKELEGSPVFYLVSPEGELKLLTRRL